MPEADLLQQAQHLIDHGEPDKALKLVSALHLAGKKDDIIRLLLVRAWAYKDLGQPLNAIPLLNQAQDLTTNLPTQHAQTWHFLGMCHLQLGNLITAEPLLNQSVIEYDQLHLYGPVAFGYLRLAELNTQKGLFRKANFQTREATKYFLKGKPKDLGFLAHICKSFADIQHAQQNMPAYLALAAMAAGFSLITHGPGPTLRYLQRTNKSPITA